MLVDEVFCDDEGFCDGDAGQKESAASETAYFTCPAGKAVHCSASSLGWL